VISQHQDLIDSLKEENVELNEINGDLVETLRGYEVKHQELKDENVILK
jgi:arginine deiminase